MGIGLSSGYGWEERDLGLETEFSLWDCSHCPIHRWLGDIKINNTAKQHRKKLL